MVPVPWLPVELDSNSAPPDALSSPCGETVDHATTSFNHHYRHQEVLQHGKPTLHGPGFSTYVRSCRIALAEKGVDYTLNEFNFLEGWPDGYEKLHPFMKVPAFEHGRCHPARDAGHHGLREHGVRRARPDAAVAAARAKCVQVINVIDNYAYNALITRTFIPRAVVPMLGGTDRRVRHRWRKGRLRAGHRRVGLDAWRQQPLRRRRGLACGLPPVPVLHYTSQIPEGQALLTKAPALGTWMERMSNRESVSSTVPSLG